MSWILIDITQTVTLKRITMNNKYNEYDTKAGTVKNYTRMFVYSFYNQHFVKQFIASYVFMSSFKM